MPVETHPRLRPVEAFPVDIDGKNLVCLRDPQGLAGQPIFLNRFQVLLLSRMNGGNSLRDIQAEVMRTSGELLPLEHLEGLVEQLDSLHYLDSPSFQDFFAALAAEFAAAPSRPAAHAGAAYQAAPEDLSSQLESFFLAPEGPGKASGSSAASLRGLVAPHIDFHRGGPEYAHAYSAVAESPADVYIVFGTAHNIMQRRFALTYKDYETPLGGVPTDRVFVERLVHRLPQDYFVDEFTHRGEHSIEFQAVFLRFCLGSRPFKLVPILVGSFHDIWSAGRPAADHPELQAMVAAVRATMGELPAHYCFIAAADLAHVGRRFGDASGPTEASLQEVGAKDRAFLELVAAGDPEGMFRLIAEESDCRRVCGYPSIYLTLRCLPQSRGEILRYRQWSDLNGGAAVTFASLALY